MDVLEAIQGNLRAHISPPWSEIILVGVSFLCGGIVGVERERSDKPAGLRTMMLICIGSTIFTLASASPSLGVRDPARIAAQIVTGVGFLGAGAIFRERRGVSGMTTAAGIWAVAGIGMVVGAGYAGPAIALACGVLLTLSVVTNMEILIGGRCRHEPVVIVYEKTPAKVAVRIQDAIDNARGSIRQGPIRERDDGRREVTLEVCRRHREHRALLAALVDVHGVEDVRG